MDGWLSWILVGHLFDAFPGCQLIRERYQLLLRLGEKVFTQGQEALRIMIEKMFFL